MDACALTSRSIHWLFKPCLRSRWSWWRRAGC